MNSKLSIEFMVYPKYQINFFKPIYSNFILIAIGFSL